MGRTSRETRSGAGRWLWLALGIAISLAFVWLIVEQTRLETFAGAFDRLSLPLLLGALGVLALGYLARIVRWWWMLHTLEPDVGLAQCVGPYLASVAVNNVVPFRAGDALRVVGFRRQLRSPPMRVLGTVVVERVLDVAVLLAVFVVGVGGVPADVLPPGALAGAAWLFAACAGAAVFFIWLAPWLVRLRQRPPSGAFGFLGRRSWWRGVAEQLAQLGDAFLVARSFRSAAVLVGLSVVVWAFEGAMFVVVAVAFGTDPSSGAPWLSLAMGTLGTLVPSSPGYVGTFDYLAAQGYAAYAAPLGQAVAFAVTVHALLWVSLTAAGAPFAIRRAATVRRTATAEGSARTPGL